MPHFRPTLFLTFTGLAAALTVIGLFWRIDFFSSQETNRTADRAPDTQAWAAAQVVEELPVFSLPDLSGQLRDITEWQGNVLVLNVWATWCAPCREEVPMLIDAQAEYASQGLTVVGLTLDQPGPTSRFAETYGINYPLLVDDTEKREVMGQLGSDALGIPHTFIVDRDGTIVGFHLGLMTAQELDQMIQPLIQP